MVEGIDQASLEPSHTVGVGVNSWLGWGRGVVESPMMFLWSLDEISQVCLLKTAYTQITWDLNFPKLRLPLG